MSPYQQTLPLVDKTNEAGPNEQAAGRVTVQDATDDPARQRNGITDGSAETMMPAQAGPSPVRLPSLADVYAWTRGDLATAGAEAVPNTHRSDAV